VGGSKDTTTVHSLKSEGRTLKSSGQVTAVLKRKDGKRLANPRAAMLHQADSKLLLLEGRGDVLSLDLETGKVVNEWKGPEEQSLAATFPRSKFAQASDEQTFLAVNDRSLILMDPRLPGNSQAARSFKYATNVQLSCVASDEQGRIAVGSKTGQLRLFDGEANRDGALKRAKSLLDGFGDPVSHVEVSADGSWLLATCGGYIALLGLHVSAGVTGFTKSLSGEPSSVTTLAISGSDLAAHGIKRLHFAPARFSPGETAILSAVGPLAVSWELPAAKKGKSVYTLKKMHATIIDADTVATDPSCVVALFSGGVALASRRKRD
jgi:WD40 repeat protein